MYYSGLEMCNGCIENLELYTRINQFHRSDTCSYSANQPTTKKYQIQSQLQSQARVELGPGTQRGHQHHQIG